MAEIFNLNGGLRNSPLGTIGAGYASDRH